MIEQYSRLFTQVEAEIGTRNLSDLLLGALGDMIQAYKGATVEEFCGQMKEILEVVNNTEPRFAILIDNVYHFLDEAEHELNITNGSTHAFRSHRSALHSIINDILEQGDQDARELLASARTLDMNGKTILIHDHSSSVQDALCALKDEGQNFDVIVAEQDTEKTLWNIESLTKNQIPFVVVPAYMLSNIEEDIDAFFMGSLTLKSTYDFVVETGTGAIVSQCRLHDTEVYMFLTTAKFALWKSEKHERHTRHRRHTRKHPHRNISFERLKFSHDRVPLHEIDYVVTERGICSAEETRKLYDKRLKKRIEQEKKQKKR
jgi:translation initiation factor 2B subunit (eIF-2B alpha/beta/delta family)